VSQGFFSTLGIQMLYGRDFTAADDTTGLSVAVVNDVIAKRYWSGTDALGKRIRVTGDDTWFTIVGVVASARDQDVAANPRPHIYVSLPQSGGNRLSLAVRTIGYANAVDLIRGIAERWPDPDHRVRPLSGFVDQSLATRRLTQILLTAFAILAVVLAGVGVYGVMSLHVANRHREFGIRLAIGAEPRALVRLVLGEGLLLAVLGVGLGIGGALIATRWIGSLLYDVSPTDPIVFVSLPLALASIAVASCYLPARRAAKSDPMQAMRAIDEKAELRLWWRTQRTRASGQPGASR
jgi:predicted lysophospholipase L1 biosynthesis ABC-type transport system permease subunit